MENKDELLYYLAFSHFLGIGPIRFAGLIKKFKCAKKAYLANKKELREILGETTINRLIDFRRRFNPKKKLEEIKKKNIEVIPSFDGRYPESLKNISDPPICIYVKSSDRARHRVFRPPHPEPGPQAIDSKQVTSPIAIVGTRKPTSYGQQVAYKFASELTSAGMTIVSGMAMGIDTIAHRAALDFKGKTIAVLGCGVDIIYPAINRNLYEKIIENGAVISEFPPGHTVLKGLFIARNRIISALSKAVLVIEGGEHSGALITARYAGEQGKDVFALPSPITSEMAAAPNFLLRQGAKLVTSVEDIFEELNIKITPKKKEDVLKNLSEEEKEIYLLIEKTPMFVDDISLALKKPVWQIANLISTLELKGAIEKNIENYYQIRLS